MYKVLSQKFYADDPEDVAKKLLGKILVRRFDSRKVVGKIVETEAYYSESNPAFRKIFCQKF